MQETSKTPQTETSITAARREWTQPTVSKLKIVETKLNSGTGADGGSFLNNHS